MSTIALQPHAQAILDRLATVTMAGASLPVGDGVAPKKPTNAEQVNAPCAVLYLLPGGSFVPTLGCQDRDGELRFQVTYVGRVAAEARTAADKGTAALVAAPLGVEDRDLQRVHCTTPGALVERDDDIVPPLFYVPVQYRLRTFDAGTAS